MGHIDVSYLAIPMDSADEAESFSGYLNEHGVCAFVNNNTEVNCPREGGPDARRELTDAIDMLVLTWRRYWTNRRSTLLGLLCYEKR